MKKLLAILFCPFLFTSNVSALDIMPNVKTYGSTRAAYGNSTNPTICVVNTLTATASVQDSTRNGVAVKTGGLQTFLQEYDYNNLFIIFEVSGTIEYNGNIRTHKDYISVLGETAPSPGINIKPTEWTVSGHDIFLHHIHSRPGDTYPTTGTMSTNAIAINTAYWGVPHLDAPYNIVVKNCSFAWGSDQTANMGSYTAEDGVYPHDLNFIDNIVAESLARNRHEKGEHNKAQMASGGYNVMFARNLYASAGGRTPDYNGANPDADNNLWVNNYNYNYGQTIQLVKTGSIHLDIIANHVVADGDTVSSRYYKWFSEAEGCTSGCASDCGIYAVDNRAALDGGSTYTQSSASDWSGVYDVWQTPSIETLCKQTSSQITYPSGFTPLAVGDVSTYVLANAGARPADRDATDSRIITATTNKNGSVIDCITSGNKYYATETVVSAGSNWVTIYDPDFTYSEDDAFKEGYSMEVVSGIGMGQVKDITDYVKSTHTFSVSTWDTQPTSESTVRIVAICTRNLGSYPTISNNGSSGYWDNSTFPSTPHSDDDSDGYTNLEEWAHDRAALVQGTSISPQNVVPSDDATGVALTAVATFYNSDYVTSHDVWLDQGACPAGTPTLRSDNDTDGQYDMSAVLSGNYNTTFCLQIAANYNDLSESPSQGTPVTYEFTTTAESNPPTPTGISPYYHKSGAPMYYHKTGAPLQ